MHKYRLITMVLLMKDSVPTKADAVGGGHGNGVPQPWKVFFSPDSAEYFFSHFLNFQGNPITSEIGEVHHQSSSLPAALSSVNVFLSLFILYLL